MAIENAGTNGLYLPLVMKSKVNGEIILATEEHTKDGNPALKGVVIRKGKVTHDIFGIGNTHELGYYSEKWDKDVFEPFPEPITIKNKKEDGAV